MQLTELLVGQLTELFESSSGDAHGRDQVRRSRPQRTDVDLDDRRATSPDCLRQRPVEFVDAPDLLVPQSE